MAGPGKATWVKVKGKGGRMTTRAIGMTKGGGEYSQGQVITQSEFNEVRKKASEAATKTKVKTEVVATQFDLFGNPQAVTREIRREEQRGKNGKGFTPTVKAAIAKSLVTQFPDIVERLKIAPNIPHETVSELIKMNKPLALEPRVFEVTKTMPDNQRRYAQMLDGIAALKKEGYLYPLKGFNGRRMVLDTREMPDIDPSKVGTISIDIPGATTYRISRTAYAVRKFLKGAGIKPDELKTLASKSL